MSVLLEDGRVGKLTHTISSPVDESNFSISWSKTVVPSDEVKTKSEPSEFAWVKSESVKDISTGKSDKSDKPKKYVASWFNRKNDPCVIQLR